MINKTNIHLLLRTIGFFGLFFVLFSNNSRFEKPLFDLKFAPYIIILSLASICFGLYFKIKYAEEGSGILTHIVTFITLFIALLLAGSFLFGSFW